MSDVARVSSGLAPEVSAVLDRYAHDARGAYAANTVRAIKSDTALFSAWCAQHGHASLPALPETLAAFVDAIVMDKAAATVRRYVASVSHLHRAAEVQNPATSSPVRLALKRMHIAKSRQQAQAKGITWSTLKEIIKAAPETTRGLRNRALLALSYDTMCRRSELVALQVGDVKTNPAGDGTIFLARSKSDQEGEGAYRYIAADTVRAVQAWLTAAQITEGPLFRSVGKAGTIGGALDGGDVARIFKEMARAVGMDISSISGHSTRVGAAQDMAAKGQIEMPAVMQSGGWKTPAMPERYAAKLEAKRSGAAKLAVLQNRG